MLNLMNRFISDPLILIKCLAFKGCSWRAIPAHPRCAYWLTDELVGVTSSRAFKWYAKPCISVFALDQSSTSHPIDGKWWQWQKWIKKPLQVDNRPSKNEKRQIIAAYAWICSCVILRDNMIFHHYRWHDKLISVNDYSLLVGWIPRPSKLKANALTTRPREQVQ